jgi:hypothetical protein
VSRRAALGALCLAAAPLCHAWELAGTHQLIAVTRDQQEIVLGTVDFSPRPQGQTAFVLHMDSTRFSDYFLSMKEFKCLEGAGEVSCHVPYPYAQPGVVTAQDFAWLEHSLLFLYKQPRDFGARLWNGLYYKFTRDDQGLWGQPHGIDLNLISAPPDQPGTPPYHVEAADAVPPDARWLAGLRIR